MMKKRTRFIAMLLLVCTQMAVGHPSPAPTIQPPLTKQPALLTNYTWYRDVELTDEVGTWSDINVECNRLSLLFPGYTFSSTFSVGLYQFEYGYNSALPVVIIYSNL